MTKECTKSPTDEINALHEELTGNAQRSLRLAIRAGELLATQKANLPHGAWLPWLNENVNFSVRTASRYIAIYEARDRLKSDTVSNLKTAYRLLTDKIVPMTSEEAERSLGVVRRNLHALSHELMEVIPLFDQFRRIRDETAYGPEYRTFGAYLSSVGIDPEWFRLTEQLLDAFRDWTNGGALLPFLNALRLQNPAIGPWPWETD